MVWSTRTISPLLRSDACLPAFLPAFLFSCSPAFLYSPSHVPEKSRGAAGSGSGSAGVSGRRGFGSGTVVRGSGGRLVRASGVPRRRQLRAGHGHQRARDVAGRHVRPEAHRPRARVGRRHRHEHDARLPPRPGVPAGSGGLPAPRRSVPRDRATTPHPPDARAVRLGVGSVPGPRPAAAAASRRPQLRLGAESGQGRARRPGALAAPRDLREGRRLTLQGRRARAGVGPVERGGQHQRPGVRESRAEEQGRARECPAAPGLCVGEGVGTDPAAHERPLAWRRLVEAHRVVRRSIACSSRCRTSSPFTATTRRPSSRRASGSCRSTSGRSSARSTWRAATAARSRVRSRS